MDPEYRSVARILATSQAPNIIAEVTQDLLVRWPLAPSGLIPASQQLVHLGQYISTLRVRSHRERLTHTEQQQRSQRNFVDRAAHWLTVSAWQNDDTRLLRIADKADRQALVTMAEVAEQSACGLPGVALMTGVLRVLRAENVVDPVVDRCAMAVVRITEQVCNGGGRWTEQEWAAVMVVAEAVEVVGKRHVGVLAAGPAAAWMAAAVMDPQDGVLCSERIASGQQQQQQFCLERLGHPLVKDIGVVVGAIATLLASTPASVSLDSAAQIVRTVHANATATLIAFERSGQPPLPEFSGDLHRMNAAHQLLATNQLSLLHVLEAVLLRYFVDDAELKSVERELVDLWCLAVDAMASVHFVTLAFARQGVDVFKRASALALEFILMPTRSAGVADSAVRMLFRSQPCLAYMSGCSVTCIGGVRSCTVLFYIDFIEHLVGKLANDTLVAVVLPLVTRYADAQALRMVGPDWFESAHAVVLAILELVNSDDSRIMAGEVGGKAKWMRAGLVLEIVPWYTDLLLELYPGNGISGELLRIAYTAAVRAATTNSAQANELVLTTTSDASGAGNSVQQELPVSVNVGYALAWDRVQKLMAKLDDTYATPNGRHHHSTVVAGVTRRELLLCLLELTTALPLVLLPKLMDQIWRRWREEPEWATRLAVVDAVQELVLERADLARKPALANWSWQMRTEFNSSKI